VAGPAKDLTERVCADIRKGCHPHVAAQHHDIDHWDFYAWWKRGEREAQNRDQNSADPPSEYERFYHAVERAKADARIDAESRVLRTMPLAWLKLGYARADWREVNALSELEQRLAALEQQREDTANVSNRRDAYAAH
jgi:hypothetical protein